MGQAISKKRAPAANTGGLDPFSSRLANVEVQSIMNQLSAPDLLRFSRCSHRLHALADHPLAWKHLPITLGPLCNLLTARLLRHRPCKLVLDAYSMALMSILNSLHREPWGRVEELDARLLMHTHNEPLANIIAHEALKDIKTMRMQRDPAMREEQATALFQAIAALPALHTLVMEGSGGRTDSVFSLLGSAPNLTRLHFVDNPALSNPASLCLDSVSRLPYLRHLSVESPSLSGDRFLRFFTAPLMANLETLRIDQFHCQGTVAGPGVVAAKDPARPLPPVPSADFAAAMSAMSSLRSIHLCRVQDVDTWIAALPSAPALRTLTIQQDVQVAEHGQRSETRFPSSAVLSVALSRMPLLVECIVLLPARHNPGDHVAFCLEVQKLALVRSLVQLRTFSKPDELWS